MHCPNCGGLMAEGAKACPSCRQPLSPPAGDAPRRVAEPEDTSAAAGPASVVTIHNSRGAEGDPAPEAGQPPDPLIGRVLAGRYRILSKVGHGGMGVVYKAEHVKLDRPIAIKVLNADLAHNPEFASRFRREAQTAGDIEHRNAVRIYDYGDEEGVLFIAMEYLDGQPLSALLKSEGALPLGRAVRIARQAAAALEAAHQLGFVHRDFKPDNVMICQRPGREETIKVVDFGIAKRVRVDPKFSSLTRTGYLVGTPQYMSPEQVIDDDPDPRSDLYSLALVTYEMITGRLPFAGSSAQKVMFNRLVEQPKPMRVARPDMEIPPGVEEVVLKALARERDGRYASTGEFAAALDAAYAEAIAPPQPPPPEPVEPKEEGRRVWLLRNPALVAAGLLVAAGMAAGAAIFAGWPGRPAPPVIGEAPRANLVSNAAAPPPAAAETNNHGAAPRRAVDAAAALLGAVSAERLVTLAGDDAYSYFMRLREENPRHEALQRVGADVLPRLVSMGEETFRRKAGFDAEGLTEADWLRTTRVYEWACLLSPADKKLEARRKFAEGELAKRRNDTGAAERNFHAATQSDGSWALPQNSLGLLHAEKGSFADAMTYYERAIRLQPDWAVPYNNLGAAYFRLKKDNGAAAAWYRRAIEKNSRWARPHLGLGAVYESEGDIAAAVAEYKTAVELDPEGRLIDSAKVLGRIKQLENK